MPHLQYRVRPGFVFGALRQHKAGDIVEMTEAEAAGFADKLELVNETKEKDGLSQPIVDLLVDAGYETIEAAKAASDDDLLKIDGVGPKTLKQIREA